ncbi:MAG: pre-peptidase C-terminal domain-containing protein, partial [Planctomycetota bacterium]|nr:pre-peptidase C-terminal domain-containing protein [Planctomycetota bacterium]
IYGTCNQRSAGQTTAMDLTYIESGGLNPQYTIDLFDQQGRQVMTSWPLLSGNSDVSAFTPSFRAAQAGTYYARVTSNLSVEQYVLLVTRNADFYPYRSNVFTAHPLVNSVGLGLAGDAWWDMGDYFQVSLNPGDTVDLTTTTPSDSPLDPPSTTNLKMELADPAGTVVASDDNSAPDGRNPQIRYTSAAGGMYVVRIFTKTSGGGGTYVLHVTGATGDFPFQIASADPADRVNLPEEYSRLPLRFTNGVQLSTLRPTTSRSTASPPPDCSSLTAARSSSIPRQAWPMAPTCWLSPPGPSSTPWAVPSRPTTSSSSSIARLPAWPPQTCRRGRCCRQATSACK